MFASVNQMMFSKTSRRDDLISLSYLLVYLLNNGNLLENKQQFRDALIQKKESNIETVFSENSECLRKFAFYIFSLKFEEKPDYEKLKDLLIEAIDEEDVPDDEELCINNPNNSY